MELLRKLTYKNLKLNRKRTIVTIIGIILSVALITALSTLVSSFRATMIIEEKRTSGNFHYSFEDVEPDDIDNFRNNRNVESLFTATGLGYARIDGCKNKNKPYAYIMATDENGFENLPFTLLEGRAPKCANEVVIPKHLKTNGGVEYKVGQAITLEVGRRVSGKDELDQSNPYNEISEDKAENEDSKESQEELTDTVEMTFKIVGIMERPGHNIEPFTAPGYSFVTYEEKASGKTNVYVRYNKESIGDRYKITADFLGIDYEIFEKINKGVDEITSGDLVKYTAQIAKARYRFYENHYLIVFENLSESTGGTAKALYIIAAIVGFIIVVTSVYCIRNSFEISTTEKIKQFGMLSSIGATKKQIKRSVRYEAFLLGLVGIPVGIVSGVFASFVLIKLSNYILKDMLTINLSYKVSVLSIVISVVIGVITIYLSSLSSARKAAKVSPIAAIRNQGEIKIKAKKLKTPRLLSKLFGVGGVVSYKNIKRNRKKYRTTVISIIICTIIFIVISYFMSMAFDLVKLVYGEEDYSLRVGFYQSENITYDSFDKLVENVTSLDNIEDYDAVISTDMSISDCKYSKEYSDYLDDDGASGQEYFEIICVDNLTYEKYLESVEVKKTDCEGKGILINNTRVEVFNEKNNSMTYAILQMYDYKKGDILNGEVGEDKVSIELAAITDERTLGYVNTYGIGMIVVNRDTFAKLGIDLTQKELFGYAIYFDSKDATKLQDDVKNTFSGNGINEDTYSTTNIEQDAKQLKSLFIMLAIFAYGLIAVIALIGVTNIVNTISTSMELRAREFAMLRSVGMTSREFNRMIRLESIFTGAKALVIGVPVGWLFSYLIYTVELKNDMTIPFSLPIKSSIICMVVVFAVLMLIMKMSLTKINKRNIIDTIKDETM